MTTLDCLCGTLVGKTELKCIKNFEALHLNFTKCNGTGFGRSGTDLEKDVLSGVIITVSFLYKAREDKSMKPMQGFLGAF